jgi:hypothetical protein
LLQCGIKVFQRFARRERRGAQREKAFGHYISIQKLSYYYNYLQLQRGLFFHEKNLKNKAIDLFLLLLGMLFIYIGERNSLEALHATFYFQQSKGNYKS